jgi:hypothetical protein
MGSAFVEMRDGGAGETDVCLDCLVVALKRWSLWTTYCGIETRLRSVEPKTEQLNAGRRRGANGSSRGTVRICYPRDTIHLLLELVVQYCIDMDLDNSVHAKESYTGASLDKHSIPTLLESLPCVH